MSFGLVTLIFFQWKLRLHTFEWWEVYVAQTNKSSHLKLQSAFEKWTKNVFLHQFKNRRIQAPDVPKLNFDIGNGINNPFLI